MIISVHIPKCAGTSFGTVLEFIHGPRLWRNYEAILTPVQAVDGSVPLGTECIHGHFAADVFDALYPDAQVITWVRHPVERVVSHYYHFLRHPETRDAGCRRVHDERLSLRQYAEICPNLASCLVGDRRVSDFAFVGVAEHFGASLQKFSERFGIKMRLPLPRENVNPDRLTEHYTLSTEDYAYIRDLNQADMDWYGEAVAGLFGTQRIRINQAA
jgi:hypothetical protein